MEFLRANLWEIKRSAALRIYGLLLCLGHILVFTNWSLAGRLPVALASSKAQMCWPMLESCEFVRFLPEYLLSLSFGAYCAFAVVTALLMLSTRVVGVAWFFMLLTLTLQLILYFQDYRLSSNIVYLHILLTTLWLFVPNKTRVLKAIVVSYFLASGILMLSPEWLIGNWFIENLAVPEKLAEWLAALATTIVFVCPVALYFKDLRYFFSGYLLLFVYLTSLVIIGDFLEPGLLLLLVMIFPMDLFEQRKLEREFIYQSFIRPEPSKLWPWVMITLFWFAHFVPRTPVKWPSYIQHFGTLYSLTPIPPHRECRQESFLIYTDKVVEMKNTAFTNVDPSQQCDAYRNFLALRETCSEYKSKPGFQTIESYFYSRGLKDSKFSPEFESRDICKPDLTLQKLRDQI